MCMYVRIVVNVSIKRRLKSTIMLVRYESKSVHIKFYTIFVS